MAKKDAYYFQHDANALYDPKIMKLRMNMGMEGYGMWWAFLEMCRNENSSDHPYTIEEPNANQMVMMMCGVDKTTADTFITTCRAVGLITSENGRLFSESFIERMTEIDIIRNKRRTNGAKGGRPKKKPNGLAKQKQNKSSKGKDSKEKKSNNTSCVFDQFWNAYKHKKSRGQAEKAWKKIKPEDYPKVIEAAESDARNNPDNQFRKHPATWLNARCWEDEDRQDENNSTGPDNIQACMEALDGICEGSGGAEGRNFATEAAERARERFETGVGI